MTTQDLCQAAFKGDIEKVKDLLKALDITQINGKNERGQNALYCASREGHDVVVKALLAIPGIDINGQEPRGSTALHGASFFGHSKVVSLLLSAGCKIDLRKNPEGPNTLGATARQEANPDVRDVWHVFEQGLAQGSFEKGVSALEKANYPVVPIKNKKTTRPMKRQKLEKDVSESESAGLDKTRRRRTDIPEDNIIKQGMVLYREKENTWRQRGIIFYKQFVYGFGLYRPSEREPGRERLEEFFLCTGDQSLPYGVPTAKDCDPGTTFFVRSKHGDRFKEKTFKTESFEERQEWLNKIYEATVRETGTNIQLSGKKKEEFTKNWREYAKKGFFVPEQYIQSPITREDELTELVKSIEDITKEDTYYTCMKELSGPVNVLPRGQPLRDILLEVLSAPRAHDMCNWKDTAEEILKPVRVFRGKLARAMGTEQSEPFIKVLRKLDEYYLAFLNSKGAQPRPCFLRSGIERIGSRIIPRDVAEVIADPNRNTEEGIHRVVRIGDVFLKINPSAPAYEMAVGELCELIWQQGTAITLIVKIELTNASYVCQAAAAVEGLLLRDFVKELPDLVPYLDAENLTMQYLCGTLYRPLDGKLDNLIVRCEEHGDKKKLALVSIDSDEAFADEFTITATGLHDLSVRYAIWLLPGTFPPEKKLARMHVHACDKLLLHSGEYFAVRLLVHLFLQNQKMNALFDEGVITEDELLGSSEKSTNTLLATFRPGEIVRLLKDIKKAQEIISQAEGGIQFDDYLRKMFPTLSKIYEYAIEQIKSNLSNFQDVVEVQLFGYGRPFLEKLDVLHVRYPTLKEELKSYTQTAFAYMEHRKNSPEREMEILLAESIDFSVLGEKDHDEILWDIIKLNLQTVTIRNSNLFGRRHIESLLERRTLQQLTLINCTQIDDSAVNIVQVRCNQLESDQALSLVLKGCPVSSEITKKQYNNLTIKIEEGEGGGAAGESRRLTAFQTWVTENIKEGEAKEILGQIKLPQTEEGDVERVVGMLEKTVFTAEETELLIEAYRTYDIPVVLTEYKYCLSFMKYLYGFMGKKFLEKSDELLKTAITFQNEEIALYLLEISQTPCKAEILFLAIKSHLIKVSSLIVRRHSELLKEKETGDKTPLMVACGSSHPDIPELVAAMLKQHNNSQAANKDGQTALHMACPIGSEANVRLLLEAGAVFDVKDKWNQTPLHLAVRKDFEQLQPFFVMLLKLGCPVDFESLVTVVRQKNAECVKFFLEALPKLNLTTFVDALGQTLLHHARHLEAVTFLVEKNPALVKTEDNNKETPLMKLIPLLATAKRKKYLKIREICNFLLSHGADIDHINLQGHTVLHDALIKKHGGRKHLPLVVMTLIQLGASLTLDPVNDSRQMNILHLACMTGLTQVVRQLVHTLCKTNHKRLNALFKGVTSDKLTPKLVAEQCGDKNMIKELDILARVSMGTDTPTTSPVTKMSTVRVTPSPLVKSSTLPFSPTAPIPSLKGGDNMLPVRPQTAAPQAPHIGKRGNTSTNLAATASAQPPNHSTTRSETPNKKTEKG